MDGSSTAKAGSRANRSAMLLHRRRSSTNPVPRSCVCGRRRSITRRTFDARTRSCRASSMLIESLEIRCDTRSAISTDSIRQRTRCRQIEMLEIDRWALACLNDVTAKVLKGYRGLRFSVRLQRYLQFLHGDVVGQIFRHHQGPPLHLCTEIEGSPIGADGAVSRSRIRFAGCMSPILVFTSDEAWENLPGADRSVGPYRGISEGGDRPMVPALIDRLGTDLRDP